MKVELVNNRVESVVRRVESGTLIVGSVIIRVESFNNRVEHKKTHESESAGGLVLTETLQKKFRTVFI